MTMVVDDRYDPYAVFAASVQRYPELPALRIGERQWTYSELEAHAASISGWCELNTPSGSRVAVHGAKDLMAGWMWNSGPRWWFCRRSP